MEQEKEEEKKVFATQPKLFGKWEYQGIQMKDQCFQDYIAISQPKVQTFIPHSSGRYQLKKFRKAQCPIVERLVGSLQFHGRNTGKKNMAIRIVKHAFEIINLMTGRNPIEVLVKAVINTGPREDTTRITQGGIVRRQSVDVSPLRRTNIGLYHMCVGAREASFKNTKTIAECLADEIMNAEKNLSASYAVKKREETEKMAKQCR